MDSLTKAEEKVMQQLWKLKKGFLGDLLKSMPEPKPHRNTVSTILKILEDKKFVGTEQFGRNYRYFPLVKKSEYSRSRVKSLTKRFFEGSYFDLVSSMIKDKNLNAKELELLLKELKQEKK